MTIETNRPYFCEGSDAMNELEAMVDKAGVSNVVYALAHICREKADHLRSNWGDAISAKAWDKDAAILDRLPRQLNSHS